MREYSVVQMTSLSLLTGTLASFPKRSKQSALESTQVRMKLVLYMKIYNTVYPNLN